MEKILGQTKIGDSLENILNYNFQMKIISKKIHNCNSLYSENMIISFLSKQVDFWTKQINNFEQKKGVKLQNRTDSHVKK